VFGVETIEDVDDLDDMAALNNENAAMIVLSI
jgi:hypothetical protein